MLDTQTRSMISNFILTLEKTGTLKKGETREFQILCKGAELNRANKGESQFGETKLVSKRKAAEILSVSVRTIDRMSNSGGLQKRMIGGSVRFLLSDIFLLAGIRAN